MVPMKWFRVLKNDCLLFLQKIIGCPNGYIPIHHIPIVGGYRVVSYEMGSYEWSSISLRYPLRWTATLASFSLSPLHEAVCLLESSILSTSMPEVVQLGSCPIFLPVELGSLT